MPWVLRMTWQITLGSLHLIIHFNGHFSEERREIRSYFSPSSSFSDIVNVIKGALPALRWRFLVLLLNIEKCNQLSFFFSNNTALLVSINFKTSGDSPKHLSEFFFSRYIWIVDGTKLQLLSLLVLHQMEEHCLQLAVLAVGQIHSAFVGHYNR